MIDEIRIVNALGGIAVQQIEAGVVVKATVYATKDRARVAATKATAAAIKADPGIAVLSEDWTEAE